MHAQACPPPPTHTHAHPPTTTTTCSTADAGAGVGLAGVAPGPAGGCGSCRFGACARCLGAQVFMREGPKRRSGELGISGSGLVHPSNLMTDTRLDGPQSLGQPCCRVDTPPHTHTHTHTHDIHVIRTHMNTFSHDCHLSCTAPHSTA